MDYQIDYGTRNLSQPAKARPLLYASVAGRAAALGNGEVVFYDQASERTHVMTQQVLAAMNLCRQFKPLDAHVQAIIAEQPALEGQQVAVRRVLEGLAARGLLLTDGQLATRFAAGEALDPQPFAGIFIRACNRPAQLQRLLDTLGEYERRSGAARRYVIVDDSTQAPAVAEHRRLATQFARDHGAGVVHIDRAGWERIADELQAALPAHAPAARWLLSRAGGPAGGGAGMNLATLLSAGSRFALLDDDFAFPLHRHPDYRDGLAFDLRGWGTRTFTDVAAALQAGVVYDADPFELHLSLCGQTLAGISQKAAGCSIGAASLQGLDFSRTRTLAPQRRVLATANGHRGQSGSDGLAWMFLLDPKARAAALRDQETYLASLEDPALWHGTAQFTVSARGNYSPFCVDNTRLMPCTVPGGRGEDALFAGLSRLMYPEDVVLDVPYAIAHAQESVRDRKASLTRPERPDSTRCFADMAVDAAGELLAESPAQRLHGMAARLRDLGAANTASSQGYVREYLAYRRSRKIEALQASLASDPQAPAYWVADVRRLIEVNGRALGETGPARLSGCPDDADAARCAALLAGQAQQLAAALEAWPELWSRGREHGEAWLDRHRVAD